MKGMRALVTALAVAMAVDASSFPVPSEFILPFAGFLVADPTAIEPLTGGRWELIPTILFATLGSTAGTFGAYAIGAYGGRRLLVRYGRFVRISSDDLDRADRAAMTRQPLRDPQHLEHLPGRAGDRRGAAIDAFGGQQIPRLAMIEKRDPKRLRHDARHRSGRDDRTAGGGVGLIAALSPANMAHSPGTRPPRDTGG